MNAIYAIYNYLHFLSYVVRGSRKKTNNSVIYCYAPLYTIKINENVIPKLNLKSPMTSPAGKANLGNFETSFFFLRFLVPTYVLEQNLFTETIVFRSI